MPRTCTQCGGHLHRIHRTFIERFSYLAIYECRDCKDISSLPRHFRYHFGPIPRCPKCGTLRITKLKSPDRIDPMHTGFLNFLERSAGGALFHCKFCRLQFYDRRRMPDKTAPAEGEAEKVAEASAADAASAPAE